MSEKIRGREWVRGSVDAGIFSAMMIIAAFLGRENPSFVYPHILWCFLAALVFNLVNFSMLPRALPASSRMVLSVLANLCFVSLIVHYSGGAKSYFWVMYLLPVFTGCLSFGPGGILITAAAITAALTAFHAGALRADVWTGVMELVVKAGTILASAAVTMKVALKERTARRRLAEEQERSRKERLEMQEKVQHMDRLATLGTLSASVAHELNSPLTTMLGFTQVLLSREMSRRETEQSIGRIEAGAKRCKEIIADMMSLARKQKSRRKPCSVVPLIHQCVELKRYDCLVDGIAVEEEAESGVPDIPLSGPEFQQVVFNLMTNAQQAIRGHRKEGGVIRVATRLEGGLIRVTVEDNGPGISPENLGRIWESFFTTKPEGEGTGLGLAISRQIIRDQGGTMGVESDPGKGARFIIDFPAAAQSATEDPVKAPPARPSPAAQGGILVAEDDASVRELISELLASKGREVEFAGSFDEALGKIRASRPAMLIADLVMPGMPAMEFFAILEREGLSKGMSIVTITGSCPGEALERMIEERGLPTLAKPFEIKDFDETVSGAG